MDKPDKRRAWEAKRIAQGLCRLCGAEPIRKSKSGKSTIGDRCHAIQVERMRLRRRLENIPITRLTEVAT